MARNSLGDFYDPGKPLLSNATGTSTNLCLLMQRHRNAKACKGNEIVNLSNAGLGLSDIPRNHGTRECQKELFIKSSDTIQSTRRLNHFLVEVKILDNG